MPLVINTLRRGRGHTHTQTLTPTIRTEPILRNQVHAGLQVKVFYLENKTACIDYRLWMPWPLLRLNIDNGCIDLMDLTIADSVLITMTKYMQPFVFTK